MPPSYSVRRPRLTAQLTCRTRTSYTPELCLNSFSNLDEAARCAMKWCKHHEACLWHMKHCKAIYAVEFIILSFSKARTPGYSEIIESRTPHTQHLATTRTQHLEILPSCALCVPFFALLAATLI